MYFSDMYTDRRIPKMLNNDPILYGESLRYLFQHELSVVLFTFTILFKWSKESVSLILESSTMREYR